MSHRQAALFRSASVLCLTIVLALFFCAGAIAEPSSAGGSDSVQENPGEVKVPARQIPAETIENLLQENSASPGNEETGSPDSDVQAEKPDDVTDDTARNEEPDPETAESNKAEPEDVFQVKENETDLDEAPEVKPSEETDADQQPAPGDGDKPRVEASGPTNADSDSSKTVADPGLPRRKPRKPIIRKNDRRKADGNKKLKRGSDKQKHLCRALQACRNEFIRCKGKIKHPDQSPEWSVAKEACGAVYKTCVEKDFQSGEWFFTRWFYFQELNCK